MSGKQETPASSSVVTQGDGPQSEVGKTNTHDATGERDEAGETPEVTGATRLRKLLGLGKKKDDKTAQNQGAEQISEGSETAKADEKLSALPSANAADSLSAGRLTHPYIRPTTPRRDTSLSSPRVVSPAGSQIFERDVQESVSTMPNSPAIPSHIQTEDHIPAVLDASSEAITNDHLNPDSVEIVMQSSHQPAGGAVPGLGSSEAPGSVVEEDLGTHITKDETTSNYGSLDSADVRRLSFISFADVVQSEHAEHTGGRDSMHVAGMASLSSSGILRSPSPGRSPVASSGYGPASSASGSVSGFGREQSPGRGGQSFASPTSTHASSTAGELTIETMSQALKKTGSGDTSGARTHPYSPV